MHVITHYIKDIRYCRETRDWSAYVILDDKEEYIGSRTYRHEADALCDEWVYEQLRRQPALDKAA